MNDTTTQLSERDRTFTRQLLAGAPEPDDPAFAADDRERARERLQRIGVPTTDMEEWRFLSLRKLTDQSYAPAHEAGGEADEALLDAHLVDEASETRLVFVDGAYAPELSSTDGFPDGVRFGTLADPADEDLEALDAHFGTPAEHSFGEDYFGSVNAAGWRDGAYVVVPPDTLVEDVVHLVHLSTEGDDAYVTHPRNLIVTGRGSKMSVVEEYGGADDGVHLTNAFTEVSVGESAKLQHAVVQGESRGAFHIARRAIDLEEASNYESQTISYGAKLSRFDTRAHGDAEQIDCTLDGLAVLEGDQVSDTHSVMDHRQGNAGSHQLHKMIIDDQAHSVFNGKIFVQRNAQKIDAYQLNRTLQLSKRAKVNTKPQLEIFADDVSCTHGATIGQLEEEQKYYLRTRGLNEEQARDLLIYAFAAEIVETIPVDSLRERLKETVAEKTRRV